MAARSAHPRSRGEHGEPTNDYTPECGSSPLARGTRGWFLRFVGCCRLIPARAGNTPALTSSKSSVAAHPRSRGEHYADRRAMLFQCGSSPLARGTLTTNSANLSVRRLIPARAGNTQTCCNGSGPRSAHPRSRGEHSQKGTMPGMKFGSSPLARGTPHQREGQAQRRRLIPARAGNTCRLGTLHMATTAHPRSRGEHFRFFPGFERCGGSSPLARGTQIGD